MKHLIQCTGAMHYVPELYCEPNDYVVPDSAPSLAKIMLAHEKGQPIDATLINDLPYNEFENNPFHEKGLDLADLPRIAKDLDVGLKDLETQVENEKLAKRRAKAPDQSEATESVAPPEE